MYPYTGLRPFRDDERRIFFGRDAQVAQLVAKLDQFHFVALVGTSGCGKSSLLRAGLFAALRAGYMASAGARWRIAAEQPATVPFPRLAAVLAESVGSDDTTSIQQALRRRP